jgi:hypothetical protein
MATCSEIARGVGEPLAGTAPVAEVWIALEQPGPWGRKALLDSHLDQTIGAALTERCADLPVRAVTIRSIGRHGDVDPRRPRTLLIARTSRAPTLWRAIIDEPRDVLGLDLVALLAGDEPSLGEPETGSVVLVCTNGRRDQCCAVRGRDAAAELATAGHEVWESAHLGGHRFAPTVLRLPDGWMFGGPSATSLTTAACRGRSALPPHAQAAELLVLGHRLAQVPVPLPVFDLGSHQFDVDGVRVLVRDESVAPDRPETCGAPPLPAVAPVARLGQ